MKDKILIFIKYFFIAFIIILGLLIGYFLGELILQNSTEIRTKDIIECRIGLPIICGGIAAFLSVLLSDSWF